MEHTATITETTSGYAIACPECGVIGSADDLELPKLLGRFHENAFELAAIAEEMAR